ncbi:nuclear transport factor 2 family protein [Psychrobacillus glaciei]|uniref:Nuclear transport factor 2 family protein n=1 Tax=Psychrobacillus glaciei TaxID=2283160 RepID=A0A5J6SK03_9BACI|nr:nuclear transport factor 2 family protein [Psychrobacillus glaciei]QFF98178.1 nuclear transport factor 2 family protein [Psychrobacillus glaciei]
MKLIHLLILAATVLALAACNSNEDKAKTAGSASDNAPSNAQSVTDHGAKDKSQVGFQMAGGNIEEAMNVPKKAKIAIIEAFNEYMDAFNEENIDRYMKTISKKPEGFNYETEKSDVQAAFKEYDITRTAENTTIIQYDENNAQVFANLNTNLVQPSTGAKLERNGRQVTVFVKEDGKWLVTSVYFMMETSK